MFTAIFQDHYGFLAALCAVALATSALAWRLSVRLGAPHRTWWAALAATLVGVLGVTSFGGSDVPSGQCVVNHQFAEPFHTTQGIWNLGMFLPVGFFALLALRKPAPALVGVTVLPCAIELAQALVPGISRSCDSSDAEMNIVGGVLGALAAGVLLAAGRRTLDWRGWAKPAFFAALALGLAGIGVFRTAITPLNYDGTGLSSADGTQRQAAHEAARQAFGDRYQISHVYVQPCVGVRCTNLFFHVADEGIATLAWPTRRHLNILLEQRDVPGPGSFPVSGATTPRGKDDAARIADRYMRDHYPWAAHATSRKTYPVGKKATFGWLTSWRFFDREGEGGILMPRTLDVQINRAGRVSQIDVTEGPTHLDDLPEPRLSAEQAEQVVVRQENAQSARSGRGPSGLEAHATTLKAIDRGNGWRPEWLISIGTGSGEEADSSAGVGSAVGSGADSQTTAWVDAIDGTVHDSQYPAA
ncbi:VanZ family protein [Streptomyces sp. NPDC047042]|uniref:VanZ family protein n=1 Tax=Streptomyces sp. NPDC047042 TaxID=3154807 RepID=UPI00340AF7CF